jgi:hypothetical protein
MKKPSLKQMLKPLSRKRKEAIAEAYKKAIPTKGCK